MQVHVDYILLGWTLLVWWPKRVSYICAQTLHNELRFKVSIRRRCFWVNVSFISSRLQYATQSINRKDQDVTEHHHFKAGQPVLPNIHSDARDFPHYQQQNHIIQINGTRSHKFPFLSFRCTKLMLNRQIIEYKGNERIRNLETKYPRTYNEIL
jgi:hypothetical protein